LRRDEEGVEMIGHWSLVTGHLSFVIYSDAGPAEETASARARSK
jgi:hypothetical protein